MLFDRDALVDLIVRPHPLDFKAESVRERIEEWRSAEASPWARVPVLSHERLSGYPHSGGFDSKELAERIATAVPDARVLIVIREQKSILLSSYRQYVVDGGASSLHHYLYPRTEGTSRVPAFSPSYYKYHRLIEEYQRLLGREHVLALPYEMFRREPARFLGKVEQFAGLEPLLHVPSSADVRVNRGHSPAGIFGVRLVNRMFRRNDLNPTPFFDYPEIARRGRRFVRAVDRHLPLRMGRMFEHRQRTAVERFAGDRYGESNACASRLIGLDLREWDYHVEG